MRSRFARREQYRNNKSTVERVQGEAPSLTPVMGETVARAYIPNASSLPCQTTGTTVTTSSGDRHFTLGYSALGGNDVLA